MCLTSSSDCRHNLFLNKLNISITVNWQITDLWSSWDKCSDCWNHTRHLSVEKKLCKLLSLIDLCHRKHSLASPCPVLQCTHCNEDCRQGIHCLMLGSCRTQTHRDFLCTHIRSVNTQRCLQWTLSHQFLSTPSQSADPAMPSLVNNIHFNGELLSFHRGLCKCLQVMQDSLEQYNNSSVTIAVQCRVNSTSYQQHPNLTIFLGIYTATIFKVQNLSCCGTYSTATYMPILSMWTTAVLSDQTTSYKHTASDHHCLSQTDSATRTTHDYDDVITCMNECSGYSSQHLTV